MNVPIADRSTLQINLSDKILPSALAHHSINGSETLSPPSTGGSHHSNRSDNQSPTKGNPVNIAARGANSSRPQSSNKILFPDNDRAMNALIDCKPLQPLQPQSSNSSIVSSSVASGSGGDDGTPNSFAKSDLIDLQFSSDIRAKLIGNSHSLLGNLDNNSHLPHPVPPTSPIGQVPDNNRSGEKTRGIEDTDINTFNTNQKQLVLAQSNREVQKIPDDATEELMHSTHNAKVSVETSANVNITTSTENNDDEGKNSRSRRNVLCTVS